MPCEIDTARLRLRPLTPEDAARIAALCADPEVSRWLARVPHPYALADAEAFLMSVAENGDRTWAIASPGEGLVGVVGIDGPDGNLELGYWLGRPYWGRGWMSEAARAAVDAAFAEGAGALQSGAFEGNHASLAIQARLDFREIGRRLVYSAARGAEALHIDTTLTRAEWEAMP